MAYDLSNKAFGFPDHEPTYNWRTTIANECERPPILLIYIFIILFFLFLKEKKKKTLCDKQEKNTIMQGQLSWHEINIAL
ncbi:Uncharacterized protein TCM_004763 [Theobroma cacao]|uniref:Uncharacterized protein n=1 Tax=Theobroma cacao TaxID=3641 RepID=A0A061DS46_THECC|nr:Uncharacterized protein TCM_004763 [Theobroma cacao]